MTTQPQASARLVRAEQRFIAATQALEAWYATYGYGGQALTLEHEYHASQRALRAARTRYCTLATAHHWNAPLNI